MATRIMVQPQAEDGAWSIRERALLGVAVALSITFLTLVALGVIAFWRTFPAIAAAAANTPVAGTEVALRDLTMGTCVLRFERRSNLQTTYETVDCAEPHAAEVVYVVDGGDAYTQYPGDRTSIALSVAICRFVEDFGVNFRETAFEQYPTASLWGGYPGAYLWSQGHHSFQCFLFNANGEPLEGQFYQPDTFD